MTELGSCGSTKAVQALLEPAGVGRLSLAECQGERLALQQRLESARSSALLDVLARVEQRRLEHQALGVSAVSTLASKEARALQRLQAAERGEAERKEQPGLWRFLLFPKSQLARHMAKREVEESRASAIAVFRELAAHKTETASMAADPHTHARRLTQRQTNEIHGSTQIRGAG